MKHITRFRFNTADGAGEAVKSGRDEPWEISHPQGDVKRYGSVAETKAWVRKHLKGVIE